MLSRHPPGELILFLASYSEDNASTQGSNFELHIEPLAILVNPRDANFGPEALAAIRIADVIGDVAG